MASSNTSGGVLAAESFDRLSGDFLSSLAEAGHVDAAYFSLHGAMQAEHENDPEGFLLQEARRILGEAIPFVVSLDLHGVLTDRMLKHSDAVVSYHTYPHIDFFQTGQRAAKLLLKILAGETRPVTARVKIPVLARGDEMITATGSISECIRLAQQIEASPAGLSAGVMWGNPFTDVPELRTNAFVVTYGGTSRLPRITRLTSPSPPPPTAGWPGDRGGGAGPARGVRGRRLGRPGRHAGRRRPRQRRPRRGDWPLRAVGEN